MILYEQNETDFFSLGLGSIKGVKKATVTQERNGSFILEATVIIIDGEFEKLKENRIIKADADNELKDQRFRIKRITPKHNGTADIYAEHVSYLSQELSLEPDIVISGQSASGALTTWKGSIIEENPFVVDSDIPTTNSTKWRIGNISNPRQALGGVEGSILNVWGGEYLFDNYHIRLLQKRGKVSPTILAYGRNITDLEQERNISNVYTSVYPYAIYTDDNQVEHLATIDNYVVDSQYIGNYPNRNVLTIDFSSKFDKDTIPTNSRLKELADNYIKNNDIGIPRTSIKVSFLDLSKTKDYADIAPLEQVNLCDEVPIYYEKLGINTTAKVIRTVYNLLTETYDEIEVGEKRVTLSNIINDQAKAVKEIETQIGSAQASANGKNTNFSGLFGENGTGEPIATKVGDLWFKPNGTDTDMYQWNGTIWEKVIAGDFADKITERVSENEQATQTALEKANQGVADAEQARADAGLAGTTASQALADATSALSQLPAIKGDVSALQSNVTDTISNLDTFKTNTDATLLETAQRLDTTSAKAQDALDNYQVLSGTVTSSFKAVDTRFESVEGEISGKVGVTDFDAEKQRLTSLQNKVSVNTDAIEAKAEKTTVDNLSGKISENSAQLVVVNNELSTRVTRDELDSMGLQSEKRNYLVGSMNELTEAGEQLLSISSDFLTNYKNSDKKITLSFYMKVDNVKTLGSGESRLLLQVSYRNSDGTQALLNGCAKTLTAVGDSFDETIQATFENLDINSIIYARYLAENFTADNILMTKGKIEISPTYTGWIYALEDLATGDLIDSLKGRISTAETNINQNAGDITQRATKTDLDSVKGRLTTAETNIETTSEGLKLKSDKTDLDIVSGKVTNHTSQITAINSELDAKVSNTSFNSLTGRVSSAESNLNIQAGEISALNSLTDGHTTKIGKLESDYGSLSLQFGSFENKFDNLSYDNQNLLIRKNEVNGKAIDSVGNLMDWGGSSVIGHGDRIAVRAGEKITFSQIKASNNSGDDNFVRYAYYSSEWGIVRYANDKDSWTDTVPSGAVWLRVSYRTVNQIKVERGDTVTPFSLAPEDLTTVKQFSELSLDVSQFKTSFQDYRTDNESKWATYSESASGWNSDITKLKTDVDSKASTLSLNQVKETADKSWTQISKVSFDSSGQVDIAKYNTRLSTVEGNVTTVQNDLGDKADKLTVTEMADQWSVKVQSLESDIGKKVENKNYTSSNSEDIGAGNWTKFLTTTIDYQYGKVAGSIEILEKAGGQEGNYYAKIYYNHKLQDSVGSRPKVEFSLTDSRYLSSDLFKAVISSDNKTIDWYMKIPEPYQQYQFNPVMEVGDPTGRTYLASQGFVQNLPSGTQINGIETGNKAQLTVLSSEVDIRVKEGELLSQINQKAGNILIRVGDNKLNITPSSTYIENGVIKNAMIGDGQINTAKIADLAVTSAKIVNVDASKITANTLSAITTNTGNLNVSGWLTTTSDNNGIRGSYNYGDLVGGSYNPRWYDGTYALGYRYMRFTAKEYFRTDNGSRGDFTGNVESFYGPNYLKHRIYNQVGDTLLARTDINAGTVQVSDSWGETMSTTISPGGIVTPQINAQYIVPRYAWLGIYGQNIENGPSLEFTTRIYSMWMYNRTYSSASNMFITEEGTIGRTTSASKYKLDITELSQEELNGNILELKPKKWYDKKSVETYAESLSKGVTSLDDDHMPIKRYYGLIAEDLIEAGLGFLCEYGKDGQVEGIQYDRIGPMLIPIIKELKEEIEQLKLGVA